MKIPDLLYLNRYGWELPKREQSKWAELYSQITKDDGTQDLTIEYDSFTELTLLHAKTEWHDKYIPIEPLKLWNYKVLTIYTYSAGYDDARYIYGRFNNYIKEHQNQLSISIEKDRKLATDAARYATFKHISKYVPKTDKPVNREYWLQYWGGYMEGYNSTDKIL